MNKRFYSGKTYSHSTGHSCAFRQWKATSHCNLIHGYALQFEFTFGGDELDERNWIVDFGGLKPLKEWCKHMFDHTYLVAEDDPFLPEALKLNENGIAQVRVVPATGAEKFSQFIYEKLSPFIETETEGRVKIIKVEFREHGKNSAIYEPR